MSKKGVVATMIAFVFMCGVVFVAGICSVILWEVFRP